MQYPKRPPSKYRVMVDSKRYGDYTYAELEASWATIIHVHPTAKVARRK